MSLIDAQAGLQLRNLHWLSYQDSIASYHAGHAYWNRCHVASAMISSLARPVITEKAADLHLINQVPKYSTRRIIWLTLP